MKSAPYAIQAESVGGKSGVDILTRNTGTQLNQANLEALLADGTRYTNLLNIATTGQAISATNATNATNAVNFSGSLSGDVIGTQSATVVSRLRGVNISATAPTAGQVLTFDGSQYVPTTPVATAVTSVNGKTGAVVLNASDISGVVTSASIISALGYTPADTNDTRITGALSQTSFNAYVASANCTTTQSLYWNSVSSTFACQDIAVTEIQDVGVSFAAIANNHILQYNGSNIVNRSIPTCAGGEYLTFNGTAWSCVTDTGAGSAVTAVNVTAPISSTGGLTPTLSMAQANGSTNGYLASADWTTFNNKMAATSAAVIAALGYTPASEAVSGSYAQKANNLSDLTSATVARNNLGLGAAAILNVGTTAGTVAAGDDARIANALSTSTNFAGDVSGVYNSLVLADSGVNAGTYTKVTVDAKGRVTRGSSLTSSDVTTALGFTPVTNVLTNGRILIGNGSNVASAVVISGDATLANTGVLTLKNTGTASAYGAADKSLTVTTDAQGRVTVVNQNLISIVSTQVTNFATTVLGTVLTGFSAATATAVTAADSVLVAIGKLQGQLNTILNPATTMVSTSGNLTTTSTTDVLMTGMTLTPPAGTYQVYFTTSVSHGSNGAMINMALYAGGVELANSQTQTTPRVAVGLNAAALTLNQSVIGEVTVDGSQAIEIRWNTSTGTATSVGNRMMIIHRIR